MGNVLFMVLGGLLIYVVGPYQYAKLCSKAFVAYQTRSSLDRLPVPDEYEFNEILRNADSGMAFKLTTIKKRLVSNAQVYNEYETKIKGFDRSYICLLCPVILAIVMWVKLAWWVGVPFLIAFRIFYRRFDSCNPNCHVEKELEHYNTKPYKPTVEEYYAFLEKELERTNWAVVDRVDAVDRLYNDSKSAFLFAVGICVVLCIGMLFT